jgi:hypothetical protein
LAAAQRSDPGSSAGGGSSIFSVGSNRFGDLDGAGQALTN